MAFSVGQQPDFAVKVEDISKTFYFDTNQLLSLKHHVLSLLHRISGAGGRVLHPAGQKRDVLKAVNFNIGWGETVAILGRNGCGKSTLLRIIAGIYQPTQGSVKAHGRISPLIELGSGFHPDFTGRENAILYGKILGLTRSQIASKIDKIVDFSEVGNYIDRPVRLYSSGMISRLAFSVATEVEPDILLLDEVLSVGDISFQAKCKKRMEEIQKRGTTIIMVTHQVGAAQSWAKRCIYLRDGVVVADGQSKEVVDLYQKDNQ